MGMRGTSEVPKVQLYPQHETRGTSKVPQRHNSLMRELSIPLPIIGQGHMEVTSSTSSSDSITRMVRVALEENRDADPEKSALARVGIKIPHPGTYSGSADLEELEIKGPWNSYLKSMGRPLLDVSQTPYMSLNWLQRLSLHPASSGMRTPSN